jgi:DinB superfamily
VHPRLEELLRYAEDQRDELWLAVATVPKPLRDRRPNTDTWSVAEVLEHLHMVEQGIARLIRRRIEQAVAAGLEPETETTSLLNSLDHLLLLDRTNFMAAPQLVQPRGELSAEQCEVALAESRRALRDAVSTGDGLTLGTVSAPHVLLGPLTLYQWVLFLAQHERRHAEQIRDIATRLQTFAGSIA